MILRRVYQRLLQAANDSNVPEQAFKELRDDLRGTVKIDDWSHLQRRPTGISYGATVVRTPGAGNWAAGIYTPPPGGAILEAVINTESQIMSIQSIATDGVPPLLAAGTFVVAGTVQLNCALEGTAQGGWLQGELIAAAGGNNFNDGLRIENNQTLHTPLYLDGANAYIIAGTNAGSVVRTSLVVREFPQ